MCRNVPNVGPGALNDTKTIRKAGGDIFANFGAEKAGKNETFKFSLGLFPKFLPWI